jgi:uncharacterized membrane protein
MQFINEPLLGWYCLLIGVFGGLVRDVFKLFLLPMRGKKEEGGFVFLYEILFAFAFSIAFVAISSILKFPEFRAYMGALVVIGIIIYCKILRIIVAFFKKTCYNKINKKICKRKNSENNER